eukprot:TRINITY_DN32168_c0_g1_i1.p1 TRINITY_DN32168_c0_g1~~TRINITY_DN32168_c0_g1_i1.p1  ORF type:complete len:572 (+),score=84.35 TRINITY_DN32168_c0_g1_i1:81-1718(+)
MAATVIAAAGSPAEGCPAFNKGCPFTLDAKLIRASFETKTEGKDHGLPQLLQSTTLEACLGFKDGCPFKGEDSVEGLYNKLSEMPFSHRLGQPSAAARFVETTLQTLHEHSKALRSKYSTTCPVFATSCPFKTVTSGGEPLVEELDKVISSWGVAEAEAAESRTKEDGSSQTLSQVLKAGTKTVHRAAENVRFVRDFLQGKVPRESYVELLETLYHIYDVLEGALETLPEHLRHCDFDVLSRKAALAEDLRYFKGISPHEPFEVAPPSPVAQQYVGRLKHLSAERPLFLLAHAYTRYLGDLSGGQILARTAAKTYDLPPGGVGLSFYKFDDIGSTPQSVKAFKKTYRSSLDALQLSVNEADALVDEANAAFILNMLVFQERDLAAGHIQRVQSLDEAMHLVRSNPSPLKFQKAYLAGGKAGVAAGVCPFLPSDARSRDGVSAGSPARSGHGDMCPWPFIWLHDPRAALVSHPIKNMGAAIAVAALIRALWRSPQRTMAVGAGAGISALALRHVLPRHKRRAARDRAGEDHNPPESKEQPDADKHP